MGKRNARSKQIGQSQPLFFFSPVQESGAETVKMLTRQPYSFFQKKSFVYQTLLPHRIWPAERFERSKTVLFSHNQTNCP